MTFYEFILLFYAAKWHDDRDGWDRDVYGGGLNPAQVSCHTVRSLLFVSLTKRGIISLSNSACKPHTTQMLITVVGCIIVIQTFIQLCVCLTEKRLNHLHDKKIKLWNKVDIFVVVTTISTSARWIYYEQRDV